MQPTQHQQQLSIVLTSSSSAASASASTASTSFCSSSARCACFCCSSRRVALFYGTLRLAIAIVAALQLHYFYCIPAKQTTRQAGRREEGERAGMGQGKRLEKRLRQGQA